jgi:ABC-type transporter Mla subunit MlaD
MQVALAALETEAAAIADTSKELTATVERAEGFQAATDDLIADIRAQKAAGTHRLGEQSAWHRAYYESCW